MFYTGAGSLCQIVKDKTFGTASANKKSLLNMTSESITETVEKGDEGSLLVGKTASTRDLMSINASGSVSTIMRPEFAGLITHLALGGDDAVTADTANTGEYNHVMHLCSASETLPSCTVVIDRKAAVKKYAGLTVSSLKIDAAAGDYVKADIDFKGVKEEVGTIDNTVTGYTVPSYRCTSATLTMETTVMDVTTASISIDNALEEAPKTYSSGLYQGQPQHGVRSITGSFEIPYNSDVDALKDSYLKTEDTAEVKLKFTSSDQDYWYEIDLKHVNVTSVSANVGGTGMLSASVEFEALTVGADEPIVITIHDKTQAPYSLAN